MGPPVSPRTLRLLRRATAIAIAVGLALLLVDRALGATLAGAGLLLSVLLPPHRGD